MKEDMQMEASKILAFGSQSSNFGFDSPLSCGENKVYLNSGDEVESAASKMDVEGTVTSVATGGSEMIIHVNNGDVGATGNGIGALVGRKKRGRPRKHESSGNLRRPHVSPQSLHASRLEQFRPLLTIHLLAPDDVASKKSGGLPLGSLHQPYLGCLGEMNAYTTGMDFMPHVIEVSPGEDVTEKILAPIQTGPRCISILSAIGSVYNVIMRQPGFSSSDALLKYEDQYDILRLSGSYTISEDGKIETQGLNVMLACSDGHIIGGTLAGSLLAATPIQMVVGSFIPNGYKKKPKKKHQYQLRKSYSSPNLNVESSKE